MSTFTRLATFIGGASRAMEMPVRAKAFSSSSVNDKGTLFRACRMTRSRLSTYQTATTIDAVLWPFSRSNRSPTDPRTVGSWSTSPSWLLRGLMRMGMSVIGKAALGGHGQAVNRQHAFGGADAVLQFLRESLLARSVTGWRFLSTTRTSTVASKTSVRNVGAGCPSEEPCAARAILARSTTTEAQSARRIGDPKTIRPRGCRRAVAVETRSIEASRLEP
jgi:hypothetical protein